jgi:hypothetical protein
MTKTEQIREEMKLADGIAKRVLAKRFFAHHCSRKLDSALENNNLEKINEICDSFKEFNINYAQI